MRMITLPLFTDAISSRSLIADICNMPVQLPYSSSASVVLGSAMLGAAAAEEAERLGKTLDSQDAAEKSSYGMKDRLWGIMVRRRVFPQCLFMRLCAAG